MITAAHFMSGAHIRIQKHGKRNFFAFFLFIGAAKAQ